MKIINSPFDMIIQAVKELYPDTYALIRFNPDLEGREDEECGNIFFPENPTDDILINISTNIPFEGMVDVLAHELAHAAVGFGKENDAHGEKWEAAYEAIHEKYNELLDLVIENYKTRFL